MDQAGLRLERGLGVWGFGGLGFWGLGFWGFRVWGVWGFRVRKLCRS